MSSNCKCREAVLEIFGPNFIATETPKREPIRTLYVGHVSRYTTEENLKDLFSKFGRVANIFVKRARPDRKHTFAFVTFEDPEAAAYCLKNKFHLSCRGNKLYINPADYWNQPTRNPDGSLQFKSRQVNTADFVFEGFQSDFDCIDADSDAPLVIEDPDPNADDSLINKLNDDCLLKIFDYVPLIQKHLLNSVCKRWDALMSSYWHRLRTLDFQDGLFSTIPCHPNTIRLFLQLCPNIKTVKIRGYSFNKDDAESVIAIAENGPQVEEVSIDNINLTDRQLPALAHYCRGLKSLSIQNCKFPRDGGISSVLRKCVRLEELMVNGTSESTGYWLQNINHGLKKLTLNVNFIDNKFLSIALSNTAETLQELTLHFCYHKRFQVLFEPTRNFLECPDMPKLSKLSLKGLFNYVPSLFKNLTHLELESNNRVDDQFIKNVIDESPNLEKLSLSDSGDSITESGIMEVTRLRNLKDLNLSGVDSLNDSLVKKLIPHFKELTHLHLTDCDKLTDISVKKLVTELPNLQFLNIASCSSITVEIIMAARSAADANPKKVPITIVPYNTLIDTDIGSTPKVIVSAPPDCSIEEYLFDDLSLDDYDDDDDDDIFDSDDAEDFEMNFGFGLPIWDVDYFYFD